MQDAYDHIFQQPTTPGTEARDFIRPSMAAQDIFADEQVLLFQKRTALFMRRSFPAYAKTLTAAELEKLALTAQKQAAAKGFVTERQIWHYLIAVVYCGFFFEQDGQYADMLNLIGWHEAGFDKRLLLDRLLDIIDAYTQECEKDFADFGKKLRYISDFYTSPHFSGRILADLPPAEQSALGEELLRTVFPVRAQLWPAAVRHKLVAMNLEHAGRLGFSVKDGLFYLLAAVYFGRAFELSPLYPWAYFLQNRDVAAAKRGKHFISLVQKHFAQLAAG